MLLRGRPFHARIGEFAVGAALPIALQLVYVVSLPFAAQVGTGATTTFVYGYLAAASVVNITAGSLGSVTAVPLARGDFSAAQTVRHVVSASWLALVIVGAAAGAFAVAGGRVVNAVLGSSYGGEVGADLGNLVVALTPWIVVARRRRGDRVPPGVRRGPHARASLDRVGGAGPAGTARVGGRAAARPERAGVGARLLDARDARRAAGGAGGALAATARGVLAAAAVVATISLIAFAPPAAILGGLAPAVPGVALYRALFALTRPRPLVESWHYLRALR